MTDEQERTLETLRAVVQHALSPVAWIVEGDYPEPSEQMKPFVYALMTRAVDGDEEAIAALLKLFPPRLSS